MGVDVKDLVGFSEPIKKLLDLVARPFESKWAKKDADAKAHEIFTTTVAEAKGEVAAKAVRREYSEAQLDKLADINPQLAERARERLLMREIEGQLNIDAIVEEAKKSLPKVVSNDPVNADWRRKFFQEAENVCEAEMQSLWGRVLAGEVSQPGSYGLRTLETLRQLSQSEAELFRLISRLAMDDGMIYLPSLDINQALRSYGISFGDIVRLRDARLLANGDNLMNRVWDASLDSMNSTRTVLMRNNGVHISLSINHPQEFYAPIVVFTQAGKELKNLMDDQPCEEYLIALGGWFRHRGIDAKRGSFIPQSGETSLLVFEQDL